ncbi:geranylgeranyl reductase family protein [Paenibacillus phyllosphaerae]|uniref:Geranylgeranyl reductase family protein n=1 Tax=Paenibacillus phyllosphaerae TaxID=274593 RepID=A0A7W5AXB1_9BACL|nr:NAD(P)/FAD-dependent oxidoreductase [Paenibacillus phyllosphaerae]MBB3110392.1 geranylgeranyl reductase family protein [Paenibacillus phyllosphaerae]
MDKPDVIIVGAGPAGSTMARLLARHGIQVLLLEAKRHPRRKPCGESLNPGAVQALRRMGLNLEQPIIVEAPVIEGWRLHFNRTKLAVQFPGSVRGITCARDKLDHWLVDEAVQAGTELWQGVRVERLLRENGRVTGVLCRMENGQTVKKQARLIIGADGLRSTVGREAGLTKLGQLRKAAFTFHMEGVRELDPFIELHLQKGMVVGMAPVGEGLANLTVGMPSELAKNAARRKEDFVREVLGQMPHLTKRIETARLTDALLGCGPFECRGSAAAAGVILIGDAAGYYDPLTGQGIYRALRSAEMAAPMVMAALRSGLDGPLYRYNRIIREEFANAGRLQRYIELASRSPLVFKSALRGLALNRFWRERLTSVIGDIVPDGI